MASHNDCILNGWSPEDKTILATGKWWISRVGLFEEPYEDVRVG